MIHLVSMPFGAITSPSLALGLIQAQLHQARIETQAFYLNLELAQHLGPRLYNTIALSNVQLSEWLFASHAWDRPLADPTPAAFVNSHDLEWPATSDMPQKLTQLQHCREETIPAFLEQSLRRLETAGPIRVVGFSCAYFQTLASLALGRLIKRRYPEAKVVYGGSSFHDDIGRELIANTPWIDAVSTGEADDVIVPLFRAFETGAPPAGLQGIWFRDDQGIVRDGPPARPIDDKTFRELPDPVFDDFFRAAKRLGYTDAPGWRRTVVVPFESSRGCWWGEKQHCTFCGLNGNGMGYRTKPAEQVVQALRTYAARHGVRVFHATDNILAMASFGDLLPQLQAQPPEEDVEIFYHVKANYNRKRIGALAAAGITDVGPGIESLSTHLLQLMRKGVRGIQNVFFLKCCREYGMRPRWNVLLRLPGETPEDYAQMARWIPQLSHLQPPFGAGKIQLQRFSPYFSERHRWNEHVRPAPWYAALYPADQFDLARLAYTFEAEWKDVLDDSAYQEVIDRVEGWRRLWTDHTALPQLCLERREHGSAQIIDTRTDKRGTYLLDAAETAVYDAICDPARLPGITAACRAYWPGDTASRVGQILADFVAAGLALEEDGIYLGLATLERRGAPLATQTLQVLQNVV
jgi:ribosomal peptide maturation radical SAM protein 1